MFQIFNHSSEEMSEKEDGSIDLIIAGPPYNIGTKYEDFGDEYSITEYRKIMGKIFSECFRILNRNGLLIIESSDTTFLNGRYIALASLLQDICLEIGFSLKERHINFIKTKEGIELLDHGWKKNYTTKKNAHSNSHQFLVFSKSKTRFNPRAGKIFYSNYLESKEHPCPFPESHFLLLDKYFQKGNSVLDPFMGTATLGVEVLKRGGNFYGYELVKSFYETALKKLSAVKH